MPRNSSSAGAFAVVFIIGVLVGIALLASYTHVVPLTSSGPPAQPTQPSEQLPAIVQPRSASANIVAVSADTNEGIIGTAIVEITSGRGRVLISTNPFIEPDTQESVAIARAVAENYTGISLAQSDVIASFNLPIANATAQVVGGPSAGSALTVAMIAAALGTSVRPDVALTGTIQPDGSIGPIGGILEKAKAAGEAGIVLFIVPAGQSEVTYYEKVQNRTSRNGFSITRISYVPRTLSLDNYTQQWNMTTVEASSIAEAARYAIFNLTLPRQ